MAVVYPCARRLAAGRSSRHCNNNVQTTDTTVKVTPAVKARVAAIESQIKAIELQGKHSCLMHPTDSVVLQWWDFTTTLALLFTAIATPWETAFVASSDDLAPWEDPWFIIGRLIDVIFLVDMVLQGGFIMYPLEQKAVTTQIIYERTWVSNASSLTP